MRGSLVFWCTLWVCDLPDWCVVCVVRDFQLPPTRLTSRPSTRVLCLTVPQSSVVEKRCPMNANGTTEVARWKRRKNEKKREKKKTARGPLRNLECSWILFHGRDATATGGISLESFERIFDKLQQAIIHLSTTSWRNRRLSIGNHNAQQCVFFFSSSLDPASFFDNPTLQDFQASSGQFAIMARSAVI